MNPSTHLLLLKMFTGVKSFYRMLPDRFRNAIRSTPEFTEAVWRWDCCLYDVSMMYIH